MLPYYNLMISCMLILERTHTQIASWCSNHMEYPQYFHQSETIADTFLYYIKDLENTRLGFSPDRCSISMLPHN